MLDKIREQLVTYQKAHRDEVTLKTRDIRKLFEEIEDLKDALAYEKAKKDTVGFKAYHEFVSTLKKNRGLNV